MLTYRFSLYYSTTGRYPSSVCWLGRRCSGVCPLNWCWLNGLSKAGSVSNLDCIVSFTAVVNARISSMLKTWFRRFRSYPNWYILVDMELYRHFCSRISSLSAEAINDLLQDVIQGPGSVVDSVLAVPMDGVLSSISLANSTYMFLTRYCSDCSKWL